MLVYTVQSIQSLEIMPGLTKEVCSWEGRVYGLLQGRGCSKPSGTKKFPAGGWGGGLP